MELFEIILIIIQPLVLIYKFINYSVNRILGDELPEVLIYEEPNQGSSEEELSDEEIPEFLDEILLPCHQWVPIEEIPELCYNSAEEIEKPYKSEFDGFSRIDIFIDCVGVLIVIALLILLAVF